MRLPFLRAVSLPVTALAMWLMPAAALAVTDPVNGYVDALSSQQDKAISRKTEPNNVSPNGQMADSPIMRPLMPPTLDRLPPAEPFEPPTRRQPLSPAKPSAFQLFVEQATGKYLPVFGAQFFDDAARSFSPVDNAPVSADYTVGPGDELTIRAWGAIDFDYRTRVDRNGQINLPKVGTFAVAGVKVSALESHLRAQIGRIFTNFNLNVTLGQLRGVKVFVVGPARMPGVYTVSSQSTMLSAVVAAGGPSPQGSMRRVLLRRDGKVISDIDIYAFLVHGDKSKDVQLLAGDVVVFQTVGPRVALHGALDTPGIYELKTAQEPIRDVLAYAGGSPVLSNPNQLQLERIGASSGSGARFVEGFKLDDEGLQKPLRDGDVLTLLPISPQFANAVTLTGSVAQPLRHPFKPGMRVRDLIPDQEALISPDFYRRKNVLVQILDDEPVTRNGERRTRAAGPANGASSPNSNESRNAGTAHVTAQAVGTNSTAGASSTPGNGSQNSNSDSNAKGNSGNAEPKPHKPTLLFDEVNWDYAVIERLNKDTLSTQVITFNLGKAVLQNDPAHNLELQVGDVVTVYSQRDIRVPVSRQTRLVSLEGEVGVPGVYQLLPGETLRQLIARAGGFTPQAYVYGMEFRREETRRRQRENLATAIVRLESVLAVQNARNAANVSDSSTAAQAAAVSNATTQAQIQRLKGLEPNGRVALELNPDSSTIDALPSLPLEDADRIMVPTRPGFVTVAGAVVNNNAFLWRAGRTAGEYLAQAGVDEGADEGNMFILRADGTVNNGKNSARLFGRKGIQSETLQPGDSLVVPNQLDYETWGRALVRNLKDFSQIFYQFGLGAAAIITLRNN